MLLSELLPETARQRTRFLHESFSLPFRIGLLFSTRFGTAAGYVLPLGAFIASAYLAVVFIFLSWHNSGIWFLSANCYKPQQSHEMKGKR
jgi:hypothetical protein